MRKHAVAIIPARGGSKRIPRKNIKLFAGEPVIAYSIKAALESGAFERVIVSSDSDAIANVALEHGAEIPFRRPAELSDDLTPTAPVLIHALEWLITAGQRVDYLCCIYATAPFVRAGDIRDGLRIMVESKCSSVFSVASFEFPVLRALRIETDGHLGMFWPEHELTRSNDLPDAYHDAGQFYWVDADIFRRERRLYGADARPVVLPRYLVQDIDTHEDWDRAELMYKLCKQEGLL